jgi:hypothetical protein
MWLATKYNHNKEIASSPLTADPRKDAMRLIASSLLMADTRNDVSRAQDRSVLDSSLLPIVIGTE